MKICPSCYESNTPSDVSCRRCGASMSPAPKSCPNGHVMDPSWIECVYCKAGGAHTPQGGEPGWAAAAPRSTVLERGVPVASQGRAPVPQARKTAVEPVPETPAASVGAGGSGRHTVLYSPGQESGQGGKASEPRVVGVLVTYSWRTEGQVFAVREGRNLIGRDPERCNIVVPEDNTLSAVNTHITFRRSFVIGDNISMGGTDVNEVPVEEQFLPLPNYARIRTGSTQWIFVMVDPGTVASRAGTPGPV